MVKKKADKYTRVACGNCKNYFPTVIPEVTKEDIRNAVMMLLGSVLMTTESISCPCCKAIYYPGSNGKWFAKVTVELEMLK